MNWKTIALPLLTWAFLSACGGRSIAPDANVVAPSNFARATLVTIVSNLASYRSGRYWAFEGSPVTGPDGERGFPENWRAVAFSSRANHTATVIEVAVGLVSGTNGLVLSLNRDNKGIPGRAIATRRLSNLPAFGTCCTIETATLAKGTPLKAGTQYWVVVSTNSSENTTNATWMFNDTDQVDSFLEASYCPSNCGSASGWTPYQSDTVSGSELAYAILGSN
jgi:hypothetical protein